MLVIDFPNTFTGRKIPNFSNKLLHEEGDAIFAWAVYGRMLLEKDIQKHGSIFLTKNQHLKVSQIVDYSNSLSFFLESEISKDTRNRLSNVTTIEICEAYENFCHERGGSNTAQECARETIAISYEADVWGCKSKLHSRSKWSVC